MGFLVFVAVAAVVVGGPLVWFLWRSRLRPGAMKVALIGTTSGEAEKNPWEGALRSAVMWVRVRIARDVVVFLGPASLKYEIWVRARDEERAREVLRL